MSYQPVPTARQRSSSAVRSGSGYGSRPRSMGFYGNANYNSPYANPTANPYTTSLTNYAGGYTSNYQSPYFQNGYRSNGGGYASITIPAKAFASNYNVITPSYSSYSKNAGRRSRRDSSSSRPSSLRDRERSASRSSRSLSSGGLGAKSISLNSLNSEGYIVSGKMIMIIVFLRSLSNYIESQFFLQLLLNGTGRDVNTMC